MDPIKTGAVIRSQRQKNGMTQLELAEKLCVSDKTVSKWECGSGVPDISLLPTLARALDVDVKALLYGELQEHGSSSGNLKKLNFYVCPGCGNLLFSTEQTDAVCCGRKLSSLSVQAAAPEERLHAELSDGEWYVTSGHEMGREHYISFIAFLSNDTLILKKLYPEWSLEARFPFYAHGRRFWYCTRQGLKMLKIGKSYEKRLFEKGVFCFCRFAADAPCRRNVLVFHGFSFLKRHKMRPAVHRAFERKRFRDFSLTYSRQSLMIKATARPKSIENGGKNR